MIDAVIALVEHRPYVVALVVTFVIVATAERGYLRMGIWLVLGAVLGWLCEASSIRNGFPFGMYIYHADEFPADTWIAGVPLFASLSFAALTYFGHSLAYTLVSPLRKSRYGIVRVENKRLLQSFKLMLFAAVLTSWADLVVDPITHLGKYWWLGQIYHYDPEGFHFGVPASNYLGWVFTCGLIILANQLVDRALTVAGHPQKPAFNLPHRPLWSLGYFLGNYIFMIAMNVILFNNPAVPVGEPVGWIMVNTLLLIAIWFAFCIAMIQRGLRQGRELARR
jgi:putative membrane protein